MRAAVLMLALGLCACNSSTPTAPTPPPAPPVSPLPPISSITSIGITGNQWIATTSAPVQMTAWVYTGPGSANVVDGTEHVSWTVEPASIATIDRQGRVTPVSIGTATVVATVGDRRGTNNIRVLPDFSGNWTGEFVVTGCTGGFDFRECGRIMFPLVGEGPGVRARYPFTLTLSQDRDQVTGTLREPQHNRRNDIVAPVSGFVRLTGALVLEATVPQPNHEPFRVINWSSTVNAVATTMSGAFTQYEPRRTVFGDPYVVRTEQEFASIAKTQ